MHPVSFLIAGLLYVVFIVTVVYRVVVLGVAAAGHRGRSEENTTPP